jgi:AraC-like DNA-binding protein
MAVKQPPVKLARIHDMDFKGLPDSRVEALLRIISEYWNDEEAEGVWAERVHLSRFHFQRMFRHLMGETPGELRRRLRLECAAHRLCTTQQAVTDIAFESGYDSLEGFSRAFRRAYDLSPSHYRRIPFPRVHLPSPGSIHYDPLRGQPYQFMMKGVLNMDITDRLLDHDMWMTRRMLESAQKLTDEQLDAPVAAPQNPLPFESAEGTLREALNRLVFTKEVWLAAVGRRPFPADQDKSVVAMLQRLDSAFIEFAEVVRQVRDENRWDELFVDASCEPQESFSYGGMIAHVITFSAFRRSAALKILEKMGINDLGYGDPIEWERAVTSPKD